jgi:hypothetical protein
MMVSISSEQQQALYDDIKHDRCTRCHKKGHLRRNCPDTTPQKWEQRFDSQKSNYWVSIAKWQAKSMSTTPPTPKSNKGKEGSSSITPKVKEELKQLHMNVIDCGSDSDPESENEESEDEFQRPARTTFVDDDESRLNAMSPIPRRRPSHTYWKFLQNHRGTLRLDGKILHPGTHAPVTRFNRFLPLSSDTTDTEEEEDSDDEDTSRTAHPPAKTPYAPPKSLSAMEGSNQTPYEPASNLGAMEGSSSIQTKTTTTRPTRPYVSRDFASSYRGIPIAGEYDDDYSDDSWSSEDNKLPSHLPDHDGDLQMESSNGRLQKLSKGATTKTQSQPEKG